MSSHARTIDRTRPAPLVVPGLGRPWVRRPARVDARSAAATALGMLLVLPLGLGDGGYYGRSLTALTLALAAAAALVLLRPLDARPSSALVAGALALALLSAWVALSSLWAEPGAGVDLETRRCILYAVALVAVALVAGGRRRALLVALTTGISALTLVGIGIRVTSGVPIDPYYGSLLAEPVGYPNAMGVLTATAVVLAIGLGDGAARRGERGLRALAPFLILVLGVTGSRGGALALGVGLVALVVLSEHQERWPCVGRAALAIAIGGGLWALTVASSGGVVTTVIAAVGAAALGAALPTPRRRGACALACGLAIAGATAVAVHPPSTTSSFRSAYWKAALAEVRERPLLGSGAGSFYLTWREHRAVETDVRDAHSLYVETLSELGPVGLALVTLAVAVPLAAAVRRRGDPLGATAAAGFVVFAVHAGLDWDWEMPVVSLSGLACAGTLLACERDHGRKESS